MADIELVTFHKETDYDAIGFRIIPFQFRGSREYTLVEEKLKDGKVVADLRRCLSAEMFASLAQAVVSTLQSDIGETDGS